MGLGTTEIDSNIICSVEKPYDLRYKIMVHRKYKHPLSSAENLGTYCWLFANYDFLITFKQNAPCLLWKRYLGRVGFTLNCFLETLNYFVILIIYYIYICLYIYILYIIIYYKLLCIYIYIYIYINVK